jgi:gluconolactonase
MDHGMKPKAAAWWTLLGAAFGASVPVSVRAAESSKAKETVGTIERKDPRFDKLIPPAAVVEKLAEGMEWVEGPVWDRKGGYLLFSDIPRNLVLKWQDGAGLSDFLKPSGYTGSEPFLGREPGSNGLAFDPQGRLVLCQHGDRRIARLEEGGRFATVVDRYQGKRLNSPNDLVFHSSGDLYFTDPPYGLEKTFADPKRELDFCGVYRLKPSGELTLLSKEVKAPNGIALSPDEKTLYVASSDPEKAVWYAFDVKPDGTVGPSRIFFDATDWTKTGPGLPDGMKIDRAGNLFATGPGGVHVFTADGTHLGTLRTGVPTANVNWGGDGSVLYVTANKWLCRIQTATRGKGF